MKFPMRMELSLFIPTGGGSPSAVLKGWVDRVVRAGVAYEFSEGDSGEGVPVGLLKAKTALVFNTSNTPRERELKVFGDPLETIWKNCVFDLCGVKNFYRKMYGIIVTSTLEQRRLWLEDVRETVNKYFPNTAKMSAGKKISKKPHVVLKYSSWSGRSQIALTIFIQKGRL